MSTTFIHIKDAEGTCHSINCKQITCVSWREYPDSKPVDIIYLVDDHEIACDHKSEASYAIAENLGIDLDEFVEDEDEDEESDDSDSDDDDDD